MMIMGIRWCKCALLRLVLLSATLATAYVLLVHHSSPESSINIALDAGAVSSAQSVTRRRIMELETAWQNADEAVSRLRAPQTLGRFVECDDAALVVFVHAHRDQLGLRNRARNTWANKRISSRTRAKVFFVVGVPANDTQAQKNLEWEQDIHLDLIQGNFVEYDEHDEEAPDSVDFSDLKSVIWLDWVRRQCPGVPFVFKVNIDTFVDLISFHENLDGLFDPGNSSSDEPMSALVCKIDTFVTESQSFNETDELMRTFCARDAYLLSNDTAAGMLKTLSEMQKYLQLQAHFFTGQLAPVADLSLLEVEGLMWSEDNSVVSHDTPVVPAGNRASVERLWRQVINTHSLKEEESEPVFAEDFTTTSYTNYVVENADYCSRSPDLKVLAVVHSNPTQSDFRAHIRNTWASSQLYDRMHLRPLFFVGRSPDPRVERELRRESDLHGDIVQTDYLDSYRNLTLKAASWMRWVDQHCAQVQYILKTDDDIVVDVFRLKAYLDQLASVIDISKHKKFHCYHWRYGRIERNETHKYYVSKELFSGKRFPAYCSGSAFILTPHMSKLLYDEFLRDPKYLWIDDVYVTGILAKRVGIKHHSIAAAYTLTGMGSLKTTKNWDRLIFAHLSGAAEHENRMQLWSRMLLRQGLAQAADGSLVTASTTSAPKEANVTVSATVSVSASTTASVTTTATATTKS